MNRVKTHHVVLLLSLLVPLCSSAANYCIAVDGGFGNGGASFVAKGFALPAKGTCKPWAGYTKAGATVVLISSGTGCLSTSGKVVTFTIQSTDPPFLGSGTTMTDHIRMCPAGVGSCPIGSGQDVGTYFHGTAAPQTCTAKMLSLPDIND